MYFVTEKRVRPFFYDGVNYCPLICRENTGVIETGTGVRVTSLERTVIDSIADFEKIGGLEELLRCLILIPSLDPNKLLGVLKIYGRSQLYQKVGYILEALKEELPLSEHFFTECEKRSSASKTYLFEKRSDFVLHNRWKLFAPKDLRAIVDKGGTDYDAI